MFEGLRKQLKGPVYWLFNDDLMTVLAFLIIPTVGMPLVFSLSTTMLAIFEVVNYFIIAVFIAEYILKLFVADSRPGYVLNPWHILDLLIIMLALMDFLPIVSLPGGRASPALRLLRLLRVFTALGRSTKTHKPYMPIPPSPPTVSRMKVNTFDRSGINRCIDERSCEISVGSRPAWIDIQDVSLIDLDYISKSINVPRYILESKITSEAFPRIDYYKDFTTIFVWEARLDTTAVDYRDMGVTRNGLLIICRGPVIITICTGTHNLFDEIAIDGLTIDGEAFAMNVLLSILRHRVHEGEDIIRAVEHKIVMFEELPVGKTPHTFLEDTFHMRRSVQKSSKNLWHFRQVLDIMKVRKVTLDGITDEHLHLLDILFDEVDYLYETSQNISESLDSLRELHINTNSYELTRVMRILAVITCLALVPSTIGGLLGENILGQPFNITLFEVGFLVSSFMLLELYAFYKMGWLR